MRNRLFSFAVISDTHINADEDTCNSPYEVNAHANARFRHVARDLHQRDVDFVIHLGDHVHPVPETGAIYSQAADAYRAIANDIGHTVYSVPGNHDIGEKPLSGGPANPVTEAMIEAWSREFGAQFQTFDHGDCRFILLNAQLINSGLPADREQTSWLINALEQAKGKRIMVFLHHPPYLMTPNEPDQYDNTAEPGRRWFLDLVDKHQVEAFFCGHVHNYWFNRHGQTDYYVAPSTCFVRQDYSEMLRATPPEGTQSGRDDGAKLGYFIVNVYETGHVVRMVRTYGAEAAPDDRLPEESVSRLGLDAREIERPAIGFDLRQNWAEITEIPPTGSLDEFDRKAVRNDYHLLALQEMGVRNLRIPARDLLDPLRRQRLKDFHHLGFEITLFSFDVPGQETVAFAAELSDYLFDWEVTLSWHDIEPRAQALAAMAKRSGLPIYLSRMRTKDDIKVEGTYFHVINHGFSVDDVTQFNELAAMAELRPHLQGVIVRLGFDERPADAFPVISAALEESGLKASVHLRLGSDNPAQVLSDDLWVSNRIAEAMMLSARHPDIRVFCDTLIDVDRGFFVHHGVIDRLNNPRPALNVVKTLHSRIGALHNDIQSVSITRNDLGDLLECRAPGSDFSLFLPATMETYPTGIIESADDGHIISLLSGATQAKNQDLTGPVLLLPASSPQQS